MKNLKFRIWDKQDKTFGPFKDFVGSPLDYLISQDGELCCGYIGGDIEEADEELVCIQQFTGLKDKNGKEIYEGDILKQKHKYRPSYQSATDEQKILLKDQNWYLDGEWAWVVGKITDIIKGYHPFDDETSIEKQAAQYTITGNIFENPELLEK